jgi:DNA-directed RNA polymerase subunit K/omega
MSEINPVIEQKIVDITNNIVPNESRRTRPVITRFEATAIIGQRATAIANGAKVYIQIPKEIETDVIKIAKYELEKKETPMYILRKLGNGKYEKWHIKELSAITY